MNTVLQAYRQQNPGDQRPDDVLTTLIAEQAPDLLERFPDFAADYRQIRRNLSPGLVEGFKGSFGAAVDNLQATTFGAGAMAADIVGLDSAKNYLLEKAREQAAEASRYQPVIGSYRDIETPGDLAEYAAYGLGQVAPSALETGAAALAGGGLGGVIAKQGIKSQVSKEVAKQLMQQGVKRGAMAGMSAVTIPQSQGEIYNEIAGEENAAGISAVAGTFAGLLDLLPEGYVLGRFFRPGQKVSEPVKRGVFGYVRDMALEAGKLMPAEGTTEAAQEFINLAAAKYARNEPATLTSRDVEQMVNAGIIGSLGGAVFAPVSALGGSGRAIQDAQQLAAEASAGGLGEDAAGVAVPTTQAATNPGIAELQARARAAAAVASQSGSDSLFEETGPAFHSAQRLLAAEQDQALWRGSDKQAYLLKQDLARRQFTANDNFDAGLTEILDPVDVAVANTPVESFRRDASPAALSAQVFSEQQAAEERVRQSPQGAQLLRQDLVNRELPAELAHIQTVQEAVAMAAQATAQAEQEDFVQTQLLARDMLGTVPEGAMPPIAKRAIPDPRELGAAGGVSMTIRPTQKPTTIVTDAEPVTPTAREVSADIAFDSIVELHDFRGTPDATESRIKAMRNDGKTRDGKDEATGEKFALPRAALFLDRLTGKLYQRAVRKGSGHKLLVDSTALPVRSGKGRSPGRKFAPDFERGEGGVSIATILEQRMPDYSQRYELVGFVVLNNGAEKNRNLGRAENFFASEKFVQARQRRMLRKSRAERTGERFRQSIGAGTVKRSSREVSMPEAVENSGYVGAVPLDQVAADNAGTDAEPVDTARESELFLLRMAKLTADGAPRETVVQEVTKELRDRRGLHGAPLQQLISFVLEHTLPALRETLKTIRARQPAFYRATPTELAGLFRSVVLAIRASGGEVALFEQNLNSELQAVREAYGLQLTEAEGRSLIALGVDSIQNATGLDSTIKLLHEAAHHFAKQLPPAVQQSFHDAIARLHWSDQRWLMNPLSMDLRLLANAPREQLSPEQQQAVDALTPDELNRLRATPPDVLLVEQATEHLAMLGMERGTARGLIQQAIRFFKDVLLRVGMAVQRTLKGEQAVSDRLVRSYVENRWLQFINRDFAAGEQSITSFRNHIGAPATLREMVPVFQNLGSADPRAGQLDLETGQWHPADFAATDTASLAAAVETALKKAELGLADLTKRATSQAINLTPGVSLNTQASVINFMDATLRGVFQNPEIARLLPASIREAGNVDAQLQAFLKEYLGMRRPSLPSEQMRRLTQEASSQKDPLTGAAVKFDPNVTIADLPKTYEQREDFEGRVQTVEVSSAQDQAMRSALAQLDTLCNRTRRRIHQDIELIEKLKARSALSDKSKALLAQTEHVVVIMQKIAAHLDAEQKRLETKLGRGAVQFWGPGSEYRVPIANTGLAFTNAKVPVNLEFSPALEKTFLKHLNAMRAWLDNPENMQHGAQWVQMQRQYSALSQHYTTDYQYQRTQRFMRKSFGRSPVEVLKTIGTPLAQTAARKFQRFQNWIYRYDKDARILGSRWSDAYRKFADALGRPMNESFEETVWDAFMRAGENVDAADTQARDRIAAALKTFAGVEVKRSNPKVWEAFGELIEQTRELQKWERAVFDAMGLVVEDDLLSSGGGKASRRPLRIGYLTGRRTASKLISSLYVQMSPAWSDTLGDSLLSDTKKWVAAGEDPLRAELTRLFPEEVIRDFVEPLVRNNAPFITIKGVGQVTPYDVRAAWQQADGDMLGFLKAIHERAASGADFAATAEGVISSFERLYLEIKRGAEARQEHSISSETAPRQMMDSRDADNWPAEWVSYAKYDSTSNYVFVMQSAIQSAIGRGGFAPNGEFAALIRAAKQDLLTLRVEMEELARENMPAAKIEQEMGAAKYEKALHFDAYEWLLTNFIDHTKGLTKTTGYQIGDARTAINLLGLLSSATLQQPKSSLWQAFDPVLAPLWRAKLSPTGLRMSLDGLKSMFGVGADAIGLKFLGEIARNTRMAERRTRAGIKDPDAYITFSQKRADLAVRWQAPDGPDEAASKANRRATKGIATVRDWMNLGLNDITEGGGAAPIAAPKAVKFRPFGVFSAVSNAINNAFFNQVYNAVSDLGIRGLEYIDRAGGAEVVRKLEAGELKFTPEMLGYDRTWGIFNDKAAYDYLADSVTSKMGEVSVESFIAKAYRRREAAQGQPFEVIDNRQLMGVVTMAMSDMSLQADPTNAPLALMNSPFLRMFSTFLVWPYLQMLRGMKVFQTAKGQYTAESVLDGIATLMVAVVPATLAVTFVADLYDEEGLGKRSNLRELPADALLPGGALLYPMAALERLARGGTFGLGSEALNGMLNFDDARGGFSANNRVFLLSKFSELQNILGGLYQQEGNMTYGSTARPLLSFIGMNGALQYWQLANKQLGLENIESAYTARINAGNWLRATGRALDLDVRKFSGQGAEATAITPYLQQMELGAIAGDTGLFAQGFSRAVQEAADAGKADPIKYVKDAFAARHPLRRVFKIAPSGVEYRQMLSNMSEQGRDSVSRAIASYNSYLRRLGIEPPDLDGRRKAKGQTAVPLSQARLAAAMASYDFGADE